MLKFADVPKYMYGNTQYNMGLGYLKKWISEMKKEGGIDLSPEFQRDHVWTDEQRSKYMEFLIREGNSSRDIYWNSPGIIPEPYSDLPTTLVLVDGKQRINTALMFLDDKVKVFGHFLSEYEDGDMFLRGMRINFVMHMNNLQMSSEVLNWYLSLNDGGTVHTKEELDKVKGLYQKALQKQNKVV